MGKIEKINWEKSTEIIPRNISEVFSKSGWSLIHNLKNWKMENINKN